MNEGHDSDKYCGWKEINQNESRDCLNCGNHVGWSCKVKDGCGENHEHWQPIPPATPKAEPSKELEVCVELEAQELYQHFIVSKAIIESWPEWKQEFCRKEFERKEVAK